MQIRGLDVIAVRGQPRFHRAYVILRTELLTLDQVVHILLNGRVASLPFVNIASDYDIVARCNPIVFVRFLRIVEIVDSVVEGGESGMPPVRARRSAPSL